MRKTVCFLALLAAVLCLFGCETEKKPLTAGEISFVPGEPMEADYLEKLKKDNRVSRREFVSDGFAYGVILYGDELETTAQTPFSVEAEEKDGALILRVRGADALHPVLLPEWPAWSGRDLLALYDESGFREYLLPAGANGDRTAFRADHDGEYRVEPAKPAQSGHTVFFSIDSEALLWDLYGTEEYLDILARDGYTLHPTAIEFTPGETAYELLKRVCKERSIPVVSEVMSATGTEYVTGIGGLPAFDSNGWIYLVGGKFEMVGADEYVLRDGDRIAFRYSGQFGMDLGVRMD